MRLLCGQRDYHKDVLSLCDSHPTLVGIVLLCFCLAQAAFAQSRAHGKEDKKKLLVYSNIYVRRDDRKFCQQNKDVDIPRIYSTGNIFVINETKTGGFSRPEIRIELTNIGILNSNLGGPKTISMGVIFQADMLRI